MTKTQDKKEQRNHIARQRCIDYLRQCPIEDRPRELHPMNEGILLLDDSGGEPVWRFDDATACHYFLKWLHDTREQNHKRAELQRRRAMLHIVPVSAALPGKDLL